MAIGALAGVLAVVGTQGSGAAPAFTAGQGFAEARIASVQFVYSGASLGFNLAHATAQYEDGTGAASAGTIDSPFLDLVSSLKTCGQSGLPAGTIPPPTSVTTNSNGNRAPVHGSAPGTAGVGASSVEAHPDAEGEANISGGGLAIPGVVTASAGAVVTQALTHPGAQERTSVADIQDGAVDLFGGLIKLRGMHWRAGVEVTGADSRADHRSGTTAFTGGEITVAGATLPFPQSPSGLAGLNTLLRPFGVQIRLPQVTDQQVAGVSRASVGPLTVAIGGKTPIGPALHKLADNLPAIEAALKPNVFDPSGCNELAGLLKPIPQLNAFWNSLATDYPILAAAVVGSLDGGGELDVNLGGVDTSVDDTFYDTPTFGSPVLQTNGASTVVTPGSSTASSSAPVITPATPGAGTPSVRTIRTTVKCQTTSPAGKPMCWGGHAAAGGVAVGALTVGLLTADEARRRRRTRGRSATLSMAAATGREATHEEGPA